jgi:hypothetical protein
MNLLPIYGLFTEPPGRDVLCKYKQPMHLAVSL